MLPITKLSEPQGLRHYKTSPEPLTYNDLGRYQAYINNKNETAFFELRAQLLQEQKYICAYCGQKLRVVEKENGIPKMKTEHFIAQNDTVENDLKYQNLLGCCLGWDDKKGENHCDSKKGASPLNHIQNPASLRTRDRTICYKVRIKSEEVLIFSSDKEKDDELNKVLNLNHQYLQNRRFQIWKNEIHKQLGDRWTIARAEAVRQTYFNTPNGEHKEFKDFVLWYLEDWLSKNHK